jgi:hypothetical protein
VGGVSLLSGFARRAGRCGSKASGGRGRQLLLLGAIGFVLFALPAAAQEGLLPGQAFVTRFSGTATVDTVEGPRTIIDIGGASGVALDLRSPGFPPDGRHWLNEPHLFSATAADVGQVFGVALDDASPPNIFLTATSAFGLHRSPDNIDWMEGMWGEGGGPGTVYRLAAETGYQPELFAEITLDGRTNTGPALGNIAYDPWRKQLYVSDLETGMIHRLDAATGADLGRYDHGVEGRASFTDAATGTAMSLPPIAFDPASAARIEDCPSGDFARTPSCWNFADFRRRVWGLDVHRDATSGVVRLYYAVWGSQGFGSPDWAAAGEDQANSVWSVAIAEDGDFDRASVRREFLLPEFFRSPEAIARAGIGHPVADIAFPQFAGPAVMLLAERGGVRNLGLTAADAFAYPHESRVLRYELDALGVWQPVGRYDIGFYDRSNEGPPYVRAGAAGGVAFGMGYGATGQIDPGKPDGFVWMTGDAICSPPGPCLDPATETFTDASSVSGLQGEPPSPYQQIIPEAAFRPYPPAGSATPPTGPDQAYMVDVDDNVDETGAPDADGLARDDATRIGDVAVYQQPPPKQLDLRITKRAAAASCSAGANCAFTVTIENVGEVAYSGPLVVEDLPGNGSEMTVPPPGWACETLFPGVYQCQVEAVTLAPGDSISLEASFTVPAWWSGPVFENCVEITTPGPGEDSRPYNNSACGYAPIATPGTPFYAPDLRLTKYGVEGQCDWFDNCLFAVRITNVGAATYSGPVSFHDEVDFAASALASWAPAPEWICGPVGAIGFDCSTASLTLAPGEFVEVVLWIAAGPIAPWHPTVRNCAWIDWGGGPGDYNPGNEYDCASISRYPPGHPGAIAALDVDKDAQPTCWPGAGPGGGWLCWFRVVVTNVGGAPYFGPIEVSDTADIAPSVLADFYDPPWSCVPGIGTPGTRTCSRPGVPGGLQPGESVTLYLHFEAPAAVPVPNAVRNCATVSSDHDGDGIDEDYTSCAIALVCTAGSPDCPRDLSIIKGASSPDPCFPGFPCAFYTVVENISDQIYPGPVVMTDIPDLGVGPLTVTWPLDAVCAPAGPGYTCTWPHDLPAGSAVAFEFAFDIPPGHPGPSLTNCASVPPGIANIFAFNDEDCATAFVPFPDLAPFSPSTCERGTDCTLDVRIDNRGLLPFIGSAGLNGTLSPAVEIASIRSGTPGLSCSVTGAGLYQCRGESLNIPPGGAAELSLVVRIPGDFAADEIVHTKDMVWPDRADKDVRPENDRHVSVITITGEKEEPPPPPPPPPQTADAPDLALLKSADRPSCVAGQRCSFAFTVTNAGTAPFIGPIRIDDITTPRATRLAGGGPSPWSCSGSNGSYACTHPRTTLAPGASLTLSLAVTTATNATGSLGDCGTFGWSDSARVYAVQNALNQLGIPSGRPDGVFGPQTRRAVEAYQLEAGLPVTGQIDDVLLRRLFGSWGVGDANAGNDRSCAAIVLETPPPPPPSRIVCEAGTVRDNECVCPEGWTRRRIGPDAYRCIPPPRIVCEGGTVRNNDCVCPEGWTRRRLAPDIYRCLPPPPIVCEGGTVRNNECVCPEGWTRRRIGPNTYRCVAPPEIVCRGGVVQAGRCICPEGTVVRQTGPNAFRCVLPEPEIVCRGGTVQAGRCICPEGTVIRQTGPNAFRCVVPEPEIVCRGGSVKGNECVCPKGTVLQQTGPNAYRCVKPEPEIVCRGGTVKGNECICPKGTEPRQTGPNAWRCVEVQPKLVCEGGRIRDNECVCPKGTTLVQTGTNAFRCVPRLLETPPVLIVPRQQSAPIQ